MYTFGMIRDLDTSRLKLLYPSNTHTQLVEELGIPDPFTDWTSSAFYTPRGLYVKAPVLGEQPRLPTPLGSFWYTNVSDCDSCWSKLISAHTCFQF